MRLLIFLFYSVVFISLYLCVLIFLDVVLDGLNFFSICLKVLGDLNFDRKLERWISYLFVNVLYSYYIWLVVKLNCFFRILVEI